MMRHLFSILWCLVILTGSSVGLYSAPMPAIGPMTIRGTIEEVTWQPDKFIKASYIVRDGKRHYASGSPGKDRTFPAHYGIMLVRTRVTNEDGADPEYSHASGKPLRVVINHAQNNGFLKKGMRIAVYGYRVRGDEGGDWHYYRKIAMLRRPAR
ncbi:hypothetical protein [Chlorobium limicola]